MIKSMISLYRAIRVDIVRLAVFGENGLLLVGERLLGYLMHSLMLMVD